MGYTLLEVSLFLAISSGLTVVAILGLGPRLTNVRFTSAMRDLQSNVTKNISSSELGKNTDSQKKDCTASGTNLNVTNTGSSNSSTCVLIGRLAVFSSDRVDYRPIVGLRSTLSCAVTDKYSFDAIKTCNLARVLDVSSSYQYANRITKSPTSKTSYGYVRSPDNNAEHRFIIESPSDSQFQLSGVSTLAEKDVCYQLSGRQAHLSLSTKNSQPKLIFNGVCS